MHKTKPCYNVKSLKIVFIKVCNAIAIGYAVLFYPKRKSIKYQLIFPLLLLEHKKKLTTLV